MSATTRIFVETMQRFYAARAARDGAPGAKTGSVTAVQRTSSDLRLNPHWHVVAHAVEGNERRAGISA